MKHGYEFADASESQTADASAAKIKKQKSKEQRLASQTNPIS
ncbi:hypothetical protein [Paraburkholderia azotifigens]